MTRCDASEIENVGTSATLRARVAERSARRESSRSNGIGRQVISASSEVGRQPVAEVLEYACWPRVETEPSADRLLVGQHFIGVVDGSTPKPWERPDKPDGARVAEAVVQAMDSTPATTSARDAVDRLTAAVASLWPGPEEPNKMRPCATFAVLAVARRELWRVGDPWLVLDGEVLPRQPTRESEVAEERAALLRKRLAAGAKLDDLLRNDPGREAILSRLRDLTKSRNASTGDAFGALDGTPVPDAYIEVFSLPARAREIVIASDGYLGGAKTLVQAELDLSERLARDPLMIEHPPATKGVLPGAASFDDRTFVRVRLPAERDS